MNVTTTPTGYVMYPDIARIRNMGSAHDTAAFVVWEDVLEECTPTRPKEVACNWVVYDSAYANRGRQWADPKLASPGQGSYSQLRPMVHTAKDRSVNVFWYDGRGSKDLVMGTRLWGDTSSIGWAKQPGILPPVPDASISLGRNYPNPISLARSTIAHIEVDLKRDATVSMKIYDNLGRERGIVYEGALPSGSHVLRFDAAGLRPGMYFFVLRSADNLTSLGFIIIR